jgi:hypothetical protein
MKTIMSNEKELIKVCSLDNLNDILQSKVDMITKEIFGKTYKIKKVDIECKTKDLGSGCIEEYYYFNCKTLHQDVVVRIENIKED